MPFTGGFSCGPERYGGGEANSSKPLLQIVFESLAAQRGSAYDQTVSSIVGIELMAQARAITFDGYGTNQRLANQFNPQKMTADGLLPRWERIFNVPPLPGDTEPVRRSRVAAAFARVGMANVHQAIVDALTAVMPALFSGTILYQGPNTATSIWPGAANNTTTVPWYSTIDHISIQLSVPAAYQGVTGGVNALWWAAVGAGNNALDVLLPAWITWSFFILSSHGTACFYLDEPDLDLSVFCS